MKNKPEVVIILAMSENRVIGRENALPWSLKEDLRHFKELTTGSPCIMGRKTYESLPKRPLPNRENIVISSSFAPDAPAVQVFPSLREGIGYCSAYEKVFICGGGTIYREAMSLADTIELTLIHGQYQGDTYFPEINVAEWEQAAEEQHGAFSFITLSRKMPPPLDFFS